MIQSGVEYVEELEAMQKSPEWELHLRLQALNFSFRLLARNHEELSRLCDLVAREDMFAKIWAVEAREVLEAFMEEATRLLHNFVSSAKSLVDHTRVHVRALYANTPFEAEYNSRVTGLANTSEVRFVQDLRNYAQHYQLPLAAAEVKVIPDGPEERGFKLDLERLRAWKKWHRLSNEYLGQLGENVPLREIADSYIDAIRRFYEWLYAREEKIHQKDLDTLRARMARLSEFSERTMSSLKEQMEREKLDEERT